MIVRVESEDDCEYGNEYRVTGECGCGVRVTVTGVNIHLP